MSQSGGGAGAFGSLTLVFMRRNRSRETGWRGGGSGGGTRGGRGGGGGGGGGGDPVSRLSLSWKRNGARSWWISVVEFLSCGWIGLGGEVARRRMRMLLLWMKRACGGCSRRIEPSGGIVRWRWMTVGDGHTAPDGTVNSHRSGIEGRWNGRGALQYMRMAGSDRIADDGLLEAGGSGSQVLVQVACWAVNVHDGSGWRWSADGGAHQASGSGYLHVDVFRDCRKAVHGIGQRRPALLPRIEQRLNGAGSSAAMPFRIRPRLITIHCRVSFNWFRTFIDYFILWIKIAIGSIYPWILDRSMDYGYIMDILWMDGWMDEKMDGWMEG